MNSEAGIPLGRNATMYMIRAIAKMKTTDSSPSIFSMIVKKSMHKNNFITGDYFKWN
nr:hypothetical protein [Bacteroidota bacterium]